MLERLARRAVTLSAATLASRPTSAFPFLGSAGSFSPCNAGLDDGVRGRRGFAASASQAASGSGDSPPSSLPAGGRPWPVERGWRAATPWAPASPFAAAGGRPFSTSGFGSSASSGSSSGGGGGGGGGGGPSLSDAERLLGFSYRYARDSPGRHYVLDTLDLSRQFERSGLTSAQAEGVARAVSGSVLASLERVQEVYATKANLNMSELETRALWDREKHEFRTTVGADLTALKRDNERLRGEIDKVRQEIRWEVEKLTASQRLDLNLEKGRLRDEVARVEAKVTDSDVKAASKVRAQCSEAEEA